MQQRDYMGRHGGSEAGRELDVVRNRLQFFRLQLRKPRILANQHSVGIGGQLLGQRGFACRNLAADKV